MKSKDILFCEYCIIFYNYFVIITNSPVLFFIDLSHKIMKKDKYLAYPKGVNKEGTCSFASAFFYRKSGRHIYMTAAFSLS